jgi:lipid-A-disaccharide synthase
MITVMILAGESSGELYGSLLAKALKRKWPDIHIIGMGGSRMQEAGVELIAHLSDAFGLIEAVSSLRKINTALNNAREALKKFSPQVLIPIDYPDFNLKVAAMAKPLGVKILYYVSPQVWAWRKGRIKKIAGLVDRMMVILPFEEKLYKDAGVECEFVGHPVLEEIEEVLEEAVSYKLNFFQTINDPPIPPLEKGGKGGFEKAGRIGMWSLSPEIKTYFKSALDLNPQRPLLSILPGSRPSELNRHFPLLVAMIRQCKRDPEIASAGHYQFCIPLAPNTDAEKYRPYLEQLRREDVVIRKGESVRVLAASDMAVVASGTATLQTALLEVPMVVMYKLSPLTYQLGKRIVKVKYISLVNILSGKEIVRELLQESANPDEIIKELKKIMFDRQHKENMITIFRMIKEQFADKKPSERVAEIVMEMAGRR